MESSRTAAGTVGTVRGAEVAVEDLTIAYESKRDASRTLALQDLDLIIEAGRFVAIVGPSGCGKTTLLKSIAGLVPPTTGRITVGEDTVLEPREDTGIMLQSPTLLPWLTAFDNALLPITVKRRATRADREQLQELFARAGLDGFEKSYPGELSGGMQQRVAMCRALLTHPSLLLLDEPFGALDAMTRERMNLDLHELWKVEAPTTVLVTHSIPEAVFLCQQVVVMSSRPGRIVEIVDVPLPRERRADVMETAEFAQTCARIRKHFNLAGAQHADN